MFVKVFKNRFSYSYIADIRYASTKFPYFMYHMTALNLKNF